jgi:PAS domain S-box-containing protein
MSNITCLLKTDLKSVNVGYNIGRMGHKERISSSKKGTYFVVLFTGLIIVLAIMYGLFLGVRINLLYSTLLSSSLEIKQYVIRSRVELLKNNENPSEQTIKRAVEYLEFAELKSHEILEERENLKLIFVPFNNDSLTNKIQTLQILLIDYKDFSAKLATQDTIKDTSLIQDNWEQIFKNLEVQSIIVEKELRRIISSYEKIYRVNQLVLIIASLILCLISITIFYQSEKQKRIFKRKIEDTTIDVNKKIYRTTKVEEALQESQRKLSTLLQNLTGMVYSCKLDQVWEFDYVSDKSQLITGYNAADLVDNKKVSYHDLINPDDRRRIFEQLQKSIEERKPYQLIYRIKTATGYEKWVWEQGTAIYSEDEDEVISLEGFITDITEQKSVEDQLNLQSSALEAAVNSIVIMDGDKKVVWSNSAFTNLTGYTLKELMGETLDILKVESSPSTYEEYMWHNLSTGNSWHGEIVNKRKDGSLYDEEMTITPIKYADGKIKHYVAIKQDITERKKSEEALRESELRFRGLYENATIGLYRTTPEEKVLMANPTLLKIFGCDTSEEVEHVNYVDIEDRNYFRKELELYGKIFGFEAKWKKRDGTIIYIRESARAIKDSENKVLYYEGTIEDISDKKRIEEDLIIAKEHAEQSDKLKSEFLAQMSHEIRTPLNVILSFSGLMKDELRDVVDEEMANAFDVIDAEGKRIMRTVELILNMSELQTGSYSYRVKRIDLYKDILQKMLTGFQRIAEKKNLIFNFQNNLDETTIEGDEYSVVQIFTHLIDNAIKYTSTGKIDIVIGKDHSNNLYVDVIDTGIGIAEDYLLLLYTPFTREERGYTRNFEGNGLGLALVKKYCDLNSADIKVNSTKGKGTTFRVTFPSLN